MAYVTGLASYFGGPKDPLPSTTRLGPSADSYPGVTLGSPATLGGWWLVSAPNRRTAVVQQVDTRTDPGKSLGLTYAALGRLGYSARTFPIARGQFTATFLGMERPANMLVGPVEPELPGQLPPEPNVVRFGVPVPAPFPRHLVIVDVAFLALALVVVLAAERS